MKTILTLMFQNSLVFKAVIFFFLPIFLLGILKEKLGTQMFVEMLILTFGFLSLFSEILKWVVFFHIYTLNFDFLYFEFRSLRNVFSTLRILRKKLKHTFEKREFDSFLINPETKNTKISPLTPIFRKRRVVSTWRKNFCALSGWNFFPLPRMHFGVFPFFTRLCHIILCVAVLRSPLHFCNKLVAVRWSVVQLKIFSLFFFFLF